MLKVCECYDRWGESSEDCEWGFEATHHRQIYCRECRPIAERCATRARVQKFRGLDLEALTSSTDRVWLASWIDKQCTSCGRKGVPTFNRFLCWYCWKEASYIEHALPYEVEQELNEQDRDFANFDTDYIEPGPVTVYSSKDYTQDELQAILKS